MFKLLIIAYSITGMSHPVHTNTIEFHTMELCQQAKVKLKSPNRRIGLQGFCFRLR